MFLFSLLVPASKDDTKTLFQNCSKSLRYSCDHSSATNEGTYSLRCCTDFKLLITLVFTLSAFVFMVCEHEYMNINIYGPSRLWSLLYATDRCKVCKVFFYNITYLTVNHNLTETTFLTIDAIITFSIGAAAALVVIVLVLLSYRICRRRRQTPKNCEGAGKTMEMQNQTKPEVNNQVCVFWNGWLKRSGIIRKNRKISDER